MFKFTIILLSVFNSINCEQFDSKSLTTIIPQEEAIPVSISYVNPSRYLRYQISKSAIIFVSNIKDLISLNNKANLTNKYDENLKLLVYCPNLRVEDIMKYARWITLTGNEGKALQFEYFLIDSGNGLSLITIEWFTSKQCNLAQPTTVDFFDKTTFEWENQLRIEKKFRNFHNCILTVGFFSHQKQTLNNVITKRSNSPAGRELIDLIADKSKFTAFYPDSPVRLDILISAFSFSHQSQIEETDYTKRVYMTRTFFEVHYGFLLSKPKHYTIYEKLAMPFDKTTWILLIVTFSMAFMAILMMNLAPKRIRDTLYGENVKMPAYNVLGTFFGIGQLKLPKKNFPRFILMLFILFCLIFRTCYQSKMFEFMTTVMYKPQPKTVDDLYRENFTIIFHDNLMNPIPIFGDAERIPNITELDAAIFLNFYNNRYYGSYLKHHSNLHLSWIEKKHTEDGELDKVAFFIDNWFYNMPNTPSNYPRVFLSEIIRVDHLGYAIPRNHFIIPVVEELLQFLIPSGIVSVWNEYTTHFDAFFNELTIELDPRVLMLNDLSFGFIIWIVSCGIPLIAFIFEVIIGIKRRIEGKDENIGRENKQKKDGREKMNMNAKKEKKLVKVKNAKVYPIVEVKSKKDLEKMDEKDLEKIEEIIDDDSVKIDENIDKKIADDSIRTERLKSSKIKPKTTIKTIEKKLDVFVEENELKTHIKTKKN